LAQSTKSHEESLESLWNSQGPGEHGLPASTKTPVVEDLIASEAKRKDPSLEKVEDAFVKINKLDIVAIDRC
jgi:hypothetical protein